MSNITRPRMYMAATAALVAIPAASALLSTHDTLRTPRQFGRPSFVKLEANRQPFSELDKLRAKRLSIRQRLPDPETDSGEAAVESHGDVPEHAAKDSFVAGLEYLYEAGDERHSDDLFHIILMSSTFNKDHMSLDYAAKSCTDILGISMDTAQELSLFAKHQGFSRLGTWTREECLSMGEDLVSCDLDCRVIPFEGGMVPDSVPEIMVPDSVPQIMVRDSVPEITVPDCVPEIMVRDSLPEITVTAALDMSSPSRGEDAYLESYSS